MSNDPTFLWLDSTSWTAITAIATTALVIAGIATIITASIDARARNRPNLVPELKMEGRGQRLVLTITNYGATAARNVKVDLSKTFDAVQDDRDYKDVNAWAMQRLKAKYAKRLALIAPGQSESNIWLFSSNIVEDNAQPKSRFGPAEQEAIEISYDKLGWVSNLFGLRYQESFVVDYTRRLFDDNVTSTNDTDYQVRQIVKHLREIATNSRKIK